MLPFMTYLGMWLKRFIVDYKHQERNPLIGMLQILKGKMLAQGFTFMK